MADKRTPAMIDWYRTPIPADVFKQLHVRSDARAFVQTLGYLGVLCCSGVLTFWSWRQNWPWPATVGLLFLHGTFTAFMPNAMHELGHGTVFKTKWLNPFFTRVTAFLGWLNFEMFNASHQKHHRYTLHPPDDQEVVLPTKLLLKTYLQEAFFNYRGMYWTLKYHVRIALGRFEGAWELICYPPAQPKLRVPPRRWACTLLGGHALIAAISIWQGWWIIPLIVSVAPFCGMWLFLLCNHTQHIGLQDNVPDFRLCCRTFILNPAVRFLFWQMNYHMEHHMYAAVPCYNLKRLHEAVKHDVPPPPRGLVAVWRHIIGVLKKQEQDPSYQYVAPVPAPALTGKAQAVVR